MDDQTPLYVSLSKAPAESFFSLAITNIMFDQVASWEGAAARFISGITLYASQNLPKPVSSSASKLWKFTPPFENISIPIGGGAVCRASRPFCSTWDLMMT